ncbi:MAG: VWA domain-containing protein, partial [Deltaproteobacteria bacterium]|nr:VWA domain-containing protein [Deltaproteobacteria bacterium]
MKKSWILFVVIAAIFIAGCLDTTSHSRAVFMLLDTSGTYQHEIKKAASIVNYLLGTLTSGDSLSVARIDSASFSEKDVIAKMTFAPRPSVANRQKRLFKKKFDTFVASRKRSAFTDITGGIIQAVEYLNATSAGRKYILIFSDLKE